MNDEIKKQYNIDIEDLIIPDDLKINISKFYQNVIIIFFY